MDGFEVFDLPEELEHDFSCKDCGREFVGIFMVWDWIWERFGVGRGHLCPPCLGVRMGRPVMPGDLNHAPCNSMWFPTVEHLHNPTYLPQIGPKL